MKLQILALLATHAWMVQGAFPECEAADKALADCTVSVLSGETVNTCSGEYRAANDCNTEVLEDKETIDGIEDCRGFYEAWEPFCTIDNCPGCSEFGLSCENLPYSCGNTCINGGTCFTAALALNRCMRNQFGDEGADGDFVGPCGNPKSGSVLATMSPAVAVVAGAVISLWI
jgi:hypothetical protein